MRLLFKFFKALNSEANPWGIAIAIVLGMFVGLTPLWRLHNLFFLLAALLFRVNFASFLGSFLLFSGIAWLFDPVVDSLGAAILQTESLQGIWTAFYNTNIVQISQFNHTLTMGGFVLSLILTLPVLFGSHYIVVKYRTHIMAWFNKLQIVRMLKASKMFTLYQDWAG